jgi:hypothetical protein
MLAYDKVPPINEIKALWDFQSNEKFFHKHIWNLNINYSNIEQLVRTHFARMASACTGFI